MDDVQCAILCDPGNSPAKDVARREIGECCLQQYMHPKPTFNSISPLAVLNFTVWYYSHNFSMITTPCVVRLLAARSDCMSLAGLVYEEKLSQRLTAAGLAFWTEEDLRSKGFFKTPDAKLQVSSRTLHAATQNLTPI